MHKIGMCICAVVLAAVLLFVGYQAGIRHAIEDSIIWTVDCYNPEDPDASAWEGWDQKIYIDLDGQTYVHGMYQG